MTMPADPVVTLLPCPFCGGTDGDLIESFIRATDDLMVWAVECERCGAERASDASANEARQFWNTRTPTPASGDAGSVRLVPVEPTQAMREAATEIDIDTIVSTPARLNWEEADAIYAAMLAAAPTPDAAASEAGEVALEDGEWFYPEGDHSSDECRFSPDEVIDYALEGESVSRVVAIERAVSLPTVYAAVRVWTDAEKDERGSDDDYDYTLFATAEEARAALTTQGGAEA